MHSHSHVSISSSAVSNESEPESLTQKLFLSTNSSSWQPSTSQPHILKTPHKPDPEAQTRKQVVWNPLYKTSFLCVPTLLLQTQNPRLALTSKQQQNYNPKL